MVICSIGYTYETKRTTYKTFTMANFILSLVWVSIQFFEITPVTVCRVMAHIPSSLQSKLSDNAVLHSYVGSAPFHKAGIMLFNPKTKQTIVRRSFHQLNPTDAIIPDIPLSVPNNNDSADSNDQTTPIESVPSILPPLNATQHPTRHFPYLLRSRNKLKSHYAALSSGNNTYLPTYDVDQSTCSAGAPPYLPYFPSHQSVPFTSKSGLPSPSLIKIQQTTQHSPASISYFNSYGSFDQNFRFRYVSSKFPYYFHRRFW